MTDPIITPATEATIASGAAKVTVGGGGFAALVGLSQSIDWMGLLGLLLAFAGVAITYHFNKRRDAREAQHAKDLREEHRARMRQFEIEMEMGREVPELKNGPAESQG